MNRKYTWRRKKKIGTSTSNERMKRLDRIVRWSIAFVGQLRQVGEDGLPKSSVKASSSQRHNE
ncbi:hypothetical protein T4E_3043 [Trichinella pseudospiralis]|uniref:Uncharacterized protein n=1 Tax=Trichinella pseudospiralis TaxID=6337 RepID=A0A0V0WNJ5_TRIPS|nr:hypothetical protein T4E_3043 [Trichinella pseudospiralis]